MANTFRDSLVEAATPAEIALMHALDSDRRFKGRYTFQHEFPPYFVDFYFVGKCLAVELDGSSHLEKKEYDSRRTKEIYKKYGVRIIRFWNGYVFKDPESVLRKIFNYIPKIERKPGQKRRMNIFERYGVNEMAFKDSDKLSRGNRKRRAKVVKGARKAAMQLKRMQKPPVDGLAGR